MPTNQIVYNQRGKQNQHSLFSLYLVKARLISLYKGNRPCIEELKSAKIILLGDA